MINEASERRPSTPPERYGPPRTSSDVGRPPLAILARAHDGKLTYVQFMEDTFATARSFRKGGTWDISANPDGGETNY